jgi:hypothetical protein
MERKSFKDGVQFAWDGTSLGLASECARKYYYRMIKNVVPKTTSVHLLFGGIYASALEHFYQLRAQGSSVKDATVAVVQKAMIDSWEHPRSPEGDRLPGGKPIDFLDDKKTRINLIRTIVWYLAEFGDETNAAMTTYTLASGKAAVELSFALEMSDDILYCGHLDRVVEFGDHLYWMDQKTTSSTIGKYFFDSFRMSNQFIGYSWAGSIILGSPVRGGIIDGAQIAINFSRFERGFFSVTKARIDEWLDNALWIIEQTRSLTALRKWPMNLTACNNYGKCPYQSICSADPAIREMIIQSDFVQPEKAWDPLTPR